MNNDKGKPQIIKTKNGYYYGTTKGKSWWKRYSKKGWLARGNSEVWIDVDGVHFRRYLTKKVKSIFYKDIIGIETGKMHAGKWAGVPVIKIAWRMEDQMLVSGFSISKSKEETAKWIEIIKKNAAALR